MYFDIETVDPSGTHGDPFFWYGAYALNNNDIKVVQNFDEYWKTLFKYDTNKIQIRIGHNGVDYDLALLVAQYNALNSKKPIKINPIDNKGKSVRGVPYSLYVDNGGYAELYLRNRHKPIVIIDSRNILPGSLAKWGEKMGYPKGDTPIIDKYRKPTKEDIKYVKRDVEILRKAYIEMGGEDALKKGLLTQSSLTQNALKEEISKISETDTRKTTFRYRHNLAKEKKIKPKEKPLPAQVRTKVEEDINKIFNNFTDISIPKHIKERVRNSVIKFRFKDLKSPIDTPKYTEIIDKSLQSKTIERVNQQIVGGMKGGISYVNPKYQGKKIGKGVVLDVNSMYPAKLLQEVLPYRYVGRSEDIGNINDINTECFGMIEFKRLHARVKENKFPFIKGNTSVNRKDIFYLDEIDWNGSVVRKGKYEGAWDRTLSILEWRYMQEVYDIYEYEIRYVYYFEKDDEFTEGLRNHINHWKEVKENCDKDDPLREYAKLMLNTIWGRWGMFTKEVKNGGEKVDVGDKDTNLITAIYTTVHSRIMLNKMMNKLGNNFIYCDTDSVHILFDENIPDLESLHELLGNEIHESEFGKWSVDEVFEEARYLKPKTYINAKDGKVKVTTAGSTINVKDLSVEDFKTGYTYKTTQSAINDNGYPIIYNTTKTL